jgi:hypothetical protein
MNIFGRSKKDLTKNSSDIIKVTWSLNQPVTEISKVNSKDCALARPFYWLFIKGQVPGTVNYIFYMNDNLPLKVLGSVCLTPRKRILFFPGVIERNVNWLKSKQSEQQSIKSTGFVDHLTLEENRNISHITLLDENHEKVNKNKGGLSSFKPRLISNDILYWFGLSVKNLAFLETTPATLEFAFPCPSSDSLRRARAHEYAIKKAKNHIVQLPSNGILKQTQFIHFDFYIAPKNISMKEFDLDPPTEMPIVSNFSQILNEKIEYRACPVALEGLKERIWVLVSKYNGILADKVIIKIY